MKLATPDVSTTIPEAESLLVAMAAIAPAGVRLGCRRICEGDEDHLLPDERRSISSRHPTIRRASGAARHVAHGLLADLGLDDVSILRSPSGAPVWPDGITGSLAHDDEVAVAAVAPVSSIRCLGIDVEPPHPLPDDIFTLAVTRADVFDNVDRGLAGRLIFSAKEAVYKAVYPMDHEILGYDEIAVDLGANQATTKTGRQVRLAFCILPRVIVLAFA
ncbi:MAG: 4'-phosphopantetheinyl transferase superfamily protein [Candidatus Kaistia colombiensis]|nr:MAG: 4'-phosphopantetheinyl transferase superfamily protein [Kaistia sp.]